jgi:hypothetical protein
MKAHTIFAALAMLATFGTAQAARVLEQPERSYELSLELVTLPSTASGGISFKTCADCAYTTHVLTAATVYTVNNRPMTFEEFSLVADELQSSSATAEKTFVGLFVDVATLRVTRVSLLHR